jgi:hypothetical protein
MAEGEYENEGREDEEEEDMSGLMSRVQAAMASRRPAGAAAGAAAAAAGGYEDLDEDKEEEDNEEAEEEEATHFVTFLGGVRAADPRYASASLDQLVSTWYPTYATIAAWPGSHYRAAAAARTVVESCGREPPESASCVRAKALLAGIDPSRYTLSDREMAARATLINAIRNLARSANARR